MNALSAPYLRKVPDGWMDGWMDDLLPFYHLPFTIVFTLGKEMEVMFNLFIQEQKGRHTTPTLACFQTLYPSYSSNYITLVIA